MAFDGAVKVDTTLNLDDFKKKLDEAKKKADELAKPFDNVTKEIQKTEQALAKAESRFAEIEKQLDPTEVARAFREQGASAQESLASISKESSKLQTEITNLKETLKGLVVDKEQVETPFRAAEQEHEEYLRQYKARLEDEKRLTAEAAAAKIEVPTEPIDAAKERFSNLQSNINEVNQELGRYQQQQSAASASTEKLSNATNSQVSAINNVVNSIRKFGSGIKKAFSGALGAVVSFGRATGQALGNAVKSTGRFLKNLFTINSGIRNTRRQSGLLSGSFANLTKRIMKLAIGALIFNQIGKQIRSLITYYNEANKTNAEFVASVSLLKGSWLTAFQPLYEFVLPVLVTFINLLAKAGQYLAAFTSALFGVDPSKMQDNAEALWNNVNALRKGTKEAKKFLAPFDEIITISEQATPSADMDKIVPDFDWEVPDISWLDEFIEKLKTIHKELDLEFYYEVGDEFGKNIATQLTDALNNIPWENIQTASNNIAAGIAGLINGALAGEEGAKLFEALGKNAATAINTALGTVNTFIDKTKFKEIGQNIGKGFNSFVDEMMDKNLIGKTIANAINAAFALVNGLLSTTDLKKIGAFIAQEINSFVITLDIPLITDTINKFILGFLDLMIQLLSKTSWDVIGTKIGELLSGIKWREIFEKTGTFAASIINAIVDIVGNFARTFNWKEFGNAIAAGINTFISTVDWVAAGLALSDLALGILNAIITFIKRTDWKGAGEAVREMLVAIDWNAVATAVKDVIVGAFGALYDFFVGLLGEPLTNFLLSLVASVGTFALLLQGALTFIEIQAALKTFEKLLDISMVNIGKILGGSALIAIATFILAWKELSDLPLEVQIALDAVIAVLVGFGIALISGSGPVGLIIGAITLIATAVIDLAQEFKWFEEVVPTVQRFADDISNATRDMLNPIIENADIARDKIRELFEDSKPVTAENTLEIIEYFRNMADEAINHIDRMKEAELQYALEMAGEVAQSYEERLKVINTTYDKMIAEIDRHIAKLDEEALKAKANHGEMSSEYQNALNAYNSYVDESVKLIDNINAARDDELAKTLENFGEQAVVWEETKTLISESYDDQINTIKEKNDEQQKIIYDNLIAGQTITKDEYGNLLGVVENGLSDIMDVIVTDGDERLSMTKQRAEDITNEEKRHLSERLQEAAKARDDEIKEINKHYKELQNALDKRFKDEKDFTAEQYNVALGDLIEAQQNEIEETKLHYVDLFNETTKGMDNVHDEIDLKTGKIQTNWSKFWGGVGEFFGTWWGNQKKAAKEGATNVTEGLEEGLNIGNSNVEKATENVAKSIENTFEKKLEIKSPSKVTTRIGENTGDGLANGLKNKEGAISTIASNILSSITTTLSNGISTMQSIGSNLANAVSTGLNNAKNAITSTVSNIATSISDGFKNLLGIASPSKVFMYFGEMLGQGLAIGFEDTDNLIQNAIGDTMDSATDEISDFEQQGKNIGLELLRGLELMRNPIIDFFHSLLADINNLISNSFINILSQSKLPQIEIPRLSRSDVFDSATLNVIAEKGKSQTITQTENVQKEQDLKQLLETQKVTNALLSQLIELTKSGKNIIVNDRVLAQSATNAQRSLSRQLGETLLPT